MNDLGLFWEAFWGQFWGKSEPLGVPLGSFGLPWASLGPLLALLCVPLGPLALPLGLTWGSSGLPVDYLSSSWSPFGFSRHLFGLPWIKNGGKQYEQMMKNELPLDLARGLARPTLDLEKKGGSRSTWILVDLDRKGVKIHTTHTPHTRHTHDTHTPHTRHTHATHAPHTRRN